MENEKKDVMFQSERKQVEDYMDRSPLSPEAMVLLTEKASPAELGICTKVSDEDIQSYVQSHKPYDAHLHEGIELIANAAPAEIIAAFGI